MRASQVNCFIQTYQEMKLLPLLFWVSSAVWLWSGCCAPCDQRSLGDFALQEESLGWVSFADGSPRRYRSSDGQEKILTFNFLSRTTTERLENCRDNGNCGLCCDNFTAEIATTTLVDTDNQLTFSLQLEKNFITNDVNNASGDIDDLLTITLNGRIRCELPGLPDTTLNRSVTLNGSGFNQVLVCETDPQAAGPETGNVFRFYFRPSLGIVGFEEADGRVWSLQ